jgi:hypothetical protein
MRTRGIWLSLAFACLLACGKASVTPIGERTQAPIGQAPATPIGNRPAMTIEIKRAPPTDSSLRGKAVSLEKEGLAAEESGDPAGAAAILKDSILADSTYAYSHYDLARVQAELIARGAKKLEDELLDELAISLGIDAVAPAPAKDRISSLAESEARFAPVRESARFKALLASARPSPIPMKSLIAGGYSCKPSPYQTLGISFKEDGTYWFSATGGKDFAEGAWSFDESAGTISLNGGDPRSSDGRPFTSAEFDPSLLAVRLGIAAAKDGQPGEFILERVGGPLWDAVKKNDVMATAALLCQGILPSPYSVRASDYKNPFLMAVDSLKPALARLFVGREGVMPYPRMKVPNSHPAAAVLKAYLAETSTRLLDEGLRRTRFSAEKYQESDRYA